MEERDILFLKQLINSSEEARIKLEKAYKQKNYEVFDQIKKFLLQIQKKLSEFLT